MAASSSLQSGLVAVVKRDCPTCELVEPVLRSIADSGIALEVFVQDDPTFPDLGDLQPTDDTDLDFSFHNDIETVPTLIELRDGAEVRRIVGWSRTAWRDLTANRTLGAELPESRPGCGSLSVDPLRVDELEVRFNGSIMSSRRVTFAAMEDEFEASFDRGWTDGLPVVPPTEVRVLRMLSGTDRDPAEIVATVPPNLVEVTVEQVAINAVMAGCKPEYMPVVLAAVEAACTSEFNMHGLLATTYFSGPIIVVNGPIAEQIGMNDDGNVFGQGNRANLTIGRALQLVVRNLGGGVPGKIDMAMQGSPGKLGFCFAERERDSPFSSLAVSRGLSPDDSAVTLFAGEGPTPIVDQISREPESLSRSFALVLRTTHHPKLVIGWDAMLVVGPEHGRIFKNAGWDRDRLQRELAELLMIPGEELVRGAGLIDEGLPADFKDAVLPKFRDGGLSIVHAGGDAGLFSSVLPGWVGGAVGSELVTKKIDQGATQ
ncbi:MAG: thioredoxin family protein [Acidimicrobiales bacterium]